MVGLGTSETEFDDFVRGASTALLRTAVLLTGSVRDGEDLLQDVLVRVYLAWPRVQQPHAYTRRALVRAAQNHWRWRTRHREEPLQGVDPFSMDAAGTVDERDRVLAALRVLPARQRAVVVLRLYEGLSELETADALGCSPGTVKSQSSRAVARLRELLRDQETTSTGGSS